VTGSGSGRRGQVVSASDVRSASPWPRPLIGLAVCAPLLAACATGFGSPVRHAVANLQAANADLGTRQQVLDGTYLQIRDVLIVLPKDDVATKGSGDAFVQLSVINLGTQADEVSSATSDVASGASAIGSTDVPAKGAAGPVPVRYNYALAGLTKTLHAGESAHVTLTFANHGMTTLLVPIWGAETVGTFLPTAVPASSAAASTSVSSAPASAPASPATSGSGAAASAPASPPSPTPAPTS
jgi:hypothetical protein